MRRDCFEGGRGIVGKEAKEMEEKPSMRQMIQKLLDETSPEHIQDLALDFEKMMTYYRCAMREVETKFLVLDDQLSLYREKNPIETIKTRLKSMQSIQEKLQRKGTQFDVQSIEKNLNDVAGIRVICSFIDDVYMLADCLLKQDDITLIQKKDYIANPKSNGYRSLHLIVEIPIFLSNEKRFVRVEVQLRTIAMESWANLEHRMRYKKVLSQKKMECSAELLNECADLSHKLDLKMQQVRDIVEGL